jgi:RNA polymerase sigma-70 factor (ECF subfamily)
MNRPTSNCSAETKDIYREFRDRVYRYIKNRTGSVEDAEDILSCVFLKIHEQLDTYDRNKASLSTWIYAITRNTVNDFLRRRYRTAVQEPYDDVLIDCANDDLPVIDRLIVEEQLEELGTSLEQLPERERDIIILRFYYEHTSPQVAAIMNLSCENVRYLQHVAIGRLRKLMGADIREGIYAP